MFRFACLLLLVVPCLAWCEDKPRYETRKNHDPDGIGKFYKEREIAQVMGYLGASWLERPDREKEESPTKMLEALKIKEGHVVADVGAGSGYHAFRMSKVVGDKGKILAVDIQQEMLDLIEKKAKKEKITNIETVKGTTDDPKLPKEGVDLILMVDVYHEFEFPFEMTTKMVESLKPGGRLVFVEFRLEDKDVPIKLVHKMTERQVIKEMEDFTDMDHDETIKTLPWQHVIVFKKKEKK
jgi:ubiquinone/menaquinone biosynthesis C-methylase UbiE